jgi:hypothetical protein
METSYDQYQMRVNQINPAIFRLKLVKTEQWRENVVFETISSTIPSTKELIGYYKQIMISA